MLGKKRWKEWSKNGIVKFDMAITSQKIEISHRTIVFTISLLIGIWALVQVRSVLLQLYVAFILMTGLNPLVEKLSAIKIPRTVAIVIVYFGLLGTIVGVLAGIIPPFVDQTSTLLNRFPQILSSLGLPTIVGTNLVDQIGKLGSIPGGVVKISVAVFTNILQVVAVLVLTFYLLLARRNLDESLVVLFGVDRKEKARRLIDMLEKRLGGWVLGELILMTIIGVLTYIGLRILDIHYALPLAIFAGLLEIVPTIGPIISAIPAVIIGLSISPLTALAVIAFYFLLQTAENQLIVPKVMQTSVGLSPLVTLVVLAVGLKLGGTIGALMGVPIFLTIQVIASELLGIKQLASK